MPISAETAGRSDTHKDTPIIEEEQRREETSDTSIPSMPSETVEPRNIDEAPQQAATQPGSGSEVHVLPPPHQPSFKEKVVGYAKEFRGATLRKPETKEQGQRILQGQEVFETKKIGPGARRASQSSQSSE